MFGRMDNKIDAAVKAVLATNLPVQGKPQLVPNFDEDGNKLPPTKVYGKEYTAFVNADKQGQLFDLINYNSPKGTGVYTDAHHFANIVLDVMSSFLAGGKYSYKDAEAIVYGVPGSGRGMFNPDAIAILDKYGMLYRQ